MASFAHKEYFDARAYLTNRPKYGQECLELYKAWHEHQAAQVGTKPEYTAAVDMGCGPGQMTYLLSSAFQEVIGVDPSEVMVEAARDSKLVDETLGLKIPEGHKVSFQVSPGESSGLPSGKFDLVSAATSSHWLPWKRGDPPGKFIWKEMSRLLKPGGSLVFMTYVNVNIVGYPHIQEQMTTYMGRGGEWSKYFELSDDLSATSIGCSFLKTMPKPTEPEFDTSQTIVLRLNADSSIGKELEPSDIPPLPEWVTENTSIKTTSQPVVFNKLPYRQLGFFMRSTSAWPKYLQDHPEEKALEKECKDLPFRMLDVWRREQAQITGEKMLEWDDVVDFTAPIAFLFARKRA